MVMQALTWWIKCSSSQGCQI